MRIKTLTTLFTLTLMALFAWSAGAAVLADDEVLEPVKEIEQIFITTADAGEAGDEDVKTWTTEDGKVIMVKGDCKVETIAGDGENVMVLGSGDGDVHKLIHVGEPVQRTFLGLQLSSLTSELQVHFGASAGNGIMVSSVVAGSPAEAAGIQVGDVITAVNGTAAASVSAATRAVREMNAGDTARVEVLRNGSPMSFDAVLITKEINDFDFDFDFDFDQMSEGVDGAHKYIIRMKSGENEFSCDTANLDEAMKKLNEYLDGPEFEALIETHGKTGENIEKRLEIIEKKVEELE
jgi:membrane-associated protease RseP (regulator of RpoE activity)